MRAMRKAVKNFSLNKNVLKDVKSVPIKKPQSLSQSASKPLVLPFPTRATRKRKRRAVEMMRLAREQSGVNEMSI